MPQVIRISKTYFKVDISLVGPKTTFFVSRFFILLAIVIMVQQLLDFALTSRLHLTRNPITAVSYNFRV
jgi:hypothetical protein